MKILLIKDTRAYKQEVLDSIAEFLWDSGHEVVKTNSNCTAENTEDFDDCDYIITIGESPGTSEPDNKWSDMKYPKFLITVRRGKE